MRIAEEMKFLSWYASARHLSMLTSTPNTIAPLAAAGGAFFRSDEGIAGCMTNRALFPDNWRH